MTKLRDEPGVDARALEFLILTAARSAEVTAATWDEVDLVNKMWVIPAARMKAGKEHRILLAAEAIDLLNKLPRELDNPHLFIGSRSGHGLSAAALSKVLRRLERAETVHGFRSTFSDWAHEKTSHDHHAIEISLAHKVGNAVEESYRRGPMVEKRAKLMIDWARYCGSTPAAEGNVIEFAR